MITGIQFAEQALSSQYTGIPYSKLDCQAFVEQVAKDAGIRKPDGSVYNWKGSNSMWRTITGWKGTIPEAMDRFGKIPEGSWVFIRKTDGALKSFTHVLLPDFISYSEEQEPEILRQIRILRDPGSSDIDFLTALETLANHLKGV